jgi:hypothetical protein
MKDQKPYNAADEDQVKKKEKTLELEQLQYMADLKSVLALPAGVRVFRKILDEGKMFSTSFTGNSATFFNEGARNLALKFFADICEAAPDKVVYLILKEKEIESHE